MDPQPENIPDYPPNAEVTFLFTKTLTKTDINKGLVFVRAGNDYIRDLCTAVGIMETMQNKGITTAVYTPIGHAYMGLRIGATGNGPFWLKKNGWDKLLEGNGFKEGVKILCWGLYDATQPPEDRILFLMRREGGLEDEDDKTGVRIKAEVN